MLSSHFTRRATLTSFYNGDAGQYLDDFTDWLSQQGYRRGSIRRAVRGANKFSTIVHLTGYQLDKLTPVQLTDAMQQLSRLGKLHPKRAGLFITYLRSKGVLICPKSSPEKPLTILYEFEDWMRTHRGVMNSTLAGYRSYIVELLAECGNKPRQLTANRVRRLIAHYAETCQPSTTRCRANAIRMFLRFLVSCGRCSSGLPDAIPKMAQWKLSSLPKYMQPEDLERVISSCEGTTCKERRNKAIVLLLARLGMRAGEVAGLKLDDINWHNGTLTVIGKSRIEAMLPLPQEVGDALYDYISSARPTTHCNFVFITINAPLNPITRCAVGNVAASAIKRAGIDTPSFGSHIFRHSAATTLLRQGASLQTLSELLRHVSIETTAHYAKVDMDLQLRVAQPWPGE